MKKNKIVSLTGKFLFSALFVFAFTSCSEDVLDKINTDNSNTTFAPAKYVLADVITSTAFSNVGGDLNTYASVYSEYEVGTHNQLYNAEVRQNEPSSASTYNNTWSNIYASIKNARLVVADCSDDGAQPGNYTTKGMGEVMVALNSGILADLFGDAPYSEAALPNLVNGLPAVMNPVIDTQESIYTTIFQLLDDAIADLPKGDTHPTGAAGEHDLLYAGDAASWVKFAYGLKARYTMHLLPRSTDVAGDMQKVLDYISKSFTSASEQAAFNHYDANNLNPLFDFQWSRDAISASQSMSEKLVQRNDPRGNRVYFDPGSWAHYPIASADLNLAPNGSPVQSQFSYSYSVYTFAQTAATQLMSYHELMFLKAEALARLGKTADAKDALKLAVAAAIKNTEESVTAAMNAPAVVGYGGLQDISANAITDAQIATYFNLEVEPLFTADPLKEVMVQKYIGLWGASGEAVETYNDIRRMKALGEDFITLKNTGKFPLRFGYGNDDTTANPNVQEAFGDGQYVYTEPVWWAGGSR